MKEEVINTTPASTNGREGAGSEDNAKQEL